MQQPQNLIILFLQILYIFLKKLSVLADPTSTMAPIICRLAPTICAGSTNQKVYYGAWNFQFWQHPFLGLDFEILKNWKKKKLWFFFFEKIENKSETVFLFLFFGNLFYYEKNLKQLKNGIPLWFVFDFFFTDATLKNLISADFCSGNCFREIGFNRFFFKHKFPGKIQRIVPGFSKLIKNQSNIFSK